MPPPPKHDFCVAQAILSNFHFWKKKNWYTPQNFFSPKFFFFHPKFFFTQNCFSSKFFFTSKKIFPLSLFYAFLDVSCYPECFSPQIFFHPKFFWVKHGATQCYQAFLVSRKGGYLKHLFSLSSWGDGVHLKCLFWEAGGRDHTWSTCTYLKYLCIPEVLVLPGELRAEDAEVGRCLLCACATLRVLADEDEHHSVETRLSRVDGAVDLK